MVPARLGKCHLPAAVTEASSLACSGAGVGASHLLSQIKPHLDSSPLLFFQENNLLCGGFCRALLFPRGCPALPAQSKTISSYSGFYSFLDSPAFPFNRREIKTNPDAYSALGSQ